MNHSISKSIFFIIMGIILQLTSGTIYKFVNNMNFENVYKKLNKYNKNSRR